MIITLIGYRGCGKSSVAPLLARELGCASVDSDDEVEKRAGKSIREIFADDGEDAFRAMESAVIADLCCNDPCIIAAGGGAILAEANRHAMRSAGPVAWLKASPETLAARISGDMTSSERRPSLTGRSIEAEVAEVLAARHQLYTDAATITVHAENGSPHDIADRILRQLPGQTGEKT